MRTSEEGRTTSIPLKGYHTRKHHRVARGNTVEAHVYRSRIVEHTDGDDEQNADDGVPRRHGRLGSDGLIVQSIVK
jgi:hypothetical protein